MSDYLWASVTSAADSSGGERRSVSSRFQLGLRAVASTVRMMVRLVAPARLRQLPAIFCCTFSGRTPGSAKLLVGGTRESIVNRNTESRCSRSRSARLWLRRRFRRLRRPVAANGASDAWYRRPAAPCRSYAVAIKSMTDGGNG